jgi:hypothetical protein
MALAMPEVEEKSHFDHPDFRVNNKIFATLHPGETAGVVKVGRERMEMLVDAKPEAFSSPKGFERGGWLKLELANVESSELAMLIRESWKQVAPKKLIAALEAAPEQGEAKARASAKPVRPRGAKAPVQKKAAAKKKRAAKTSRTRA